RQESIDTILALDDTRRAGSRLVVTGCMAERYGDGLAASLPEVDLVAPFGVQLAPPAASAALAVGDRPAGTPVALTKKAAPPSFDLLNLPRPPTTAPWAYIKVAEGCDRNCGFCAIPSFRGKQRSRPEEAILTEADQLGAANSLREIVLVAQDLASYGLDRSPGSAVPRPEGPAVGSNRPIVDLVRAVAERVERTRLLYLYPSSLDDSLIEAILATGVPYFDLSLQHVSRPLLKRMRRWGEGQRFLDRIADIRRAEPTSAFRSSFIVGYPGETEADHDELLAWLGEAQLDWVGFFPYSREDGTFAADLSDQVPEELMAERLRECAELQDTITAQRRDALIGEVVDVLVDTVGEGRTYREAPEIDGIVSVPEYLEPGTMARMVVTGADGPDLIAEPTGLDQPGCTGVAVGSGAQW
ncbi:MAG TPA: radical SAM protein, partial [Acidimicrobiales bacterium]|nr:radical SAM protein [Acidimicrobiales bacterium]